MNLFYDFETTGFPVWNKPSRDDVQPHIVQMAAVLADPETHETICSVDLISKPDGWVIPEESTAVHGITTEKAEQIGIPEGAVVGILHDLWQIANLRIAHNESFDARIMRIGLFRFTGKAFADTWKAGRSYCTMNQSKQLCKIPPTDKMLAKNMKGFKPPSLAEAYHLATGAYLVDAHSAMPDVLACKAVYEWVLSNG